MDSIQTDYLGYKSLPVNDQSILNILLEANICVDILVSLETQILHPLAKQLLTALQLVDAYIHITDRRDAVLPRLAKLNNL